MSVIKSLARLFTFLRCMPALVVALCVAVSPSMLRATTVQPPTFNELVNQSDCIVRAVVKSVTAEYARPGSRRIVTKVELGVKEVIAGMPAEPLVLTLLGGRIGDEEMILEGAPQFRVGEEDILFVQGDGKQIYPLTAMMHGRYPIRRDDGGAEIVTRGNDVPLHDTAEVALPIVTVRATQSGNAIYRSAPAVNCSFVVTGNFSLWLEGRFTESERAGTAVSGPNADPDGYSNLSEYALGLEPKSASSPGLPEVRTTSTDWAYTYTRPADRSELTYTVEVSTNLGSWTTGGVVHELVSSAAGGETWRARYPLASATTAFFRLKVYL